MKPITWIAIVLTVWVSIDLGTRLYIYKTVSDVQDAVATPLIAACVEKKVSNYISNTQGKYEVSQNQRDRMARDCRSTVR